MGKKNGGKDRNSFANSFANLEQAFSHEQMAKKKSKGHATSCNITIHSVRRRLADADGVSAKAAIDGLVHCGILQDDSTAHVREVRYSQEKTNGKEKTIITLEFD